MAALCAPCIAERERKEKRGERRKKRKKKKGSGEEGLKKRKKERRRRTERKKERKRGKEVPLSQKTEGLATKVIGSCMYGLVGFWCVG